MLPACLKLPLLLLQHVFHHVCCQTAGAALMAATASMHQSRLLTTHTPPIKAVINRTRNTEALHNAHTARCLSNTGLLLHPAAGSTAHLCISKHDSPASSMLPFIQFAEHGQLLTTTSAGDLALV